MRIMVPNKSFGVTNSPWNWIPNISVHLKLSLLSPHRFSVASPESSLRSFPWISSQAGGKLSRAVAALLLGALAQAKRGRVQGVWVCVWVPPGLIQWVRGAEFDPWGRCTDRPEESGGAGGGRRRSCLFVLPLNNTAQRQPANKRICVSQERIRGSNKGMITWCSPVLNIDGMDPNSASTNWKQ